MQIDLFDFKFAIGISTHRCLKCVWIFSLLYSSIRIDTARTNELIRTIDWKILSVEAERLVLLLLTFFHKHLFTLSLNVTN